MRVYITDSKGNDEPFDINESDTVKSLKEKLINRNGVKENCQLLFNGDFLEDDKELSVYEIEENNKIIYVGAFLAGLI